MYMLHPVYVRVSVLLHGFVTTYVLWILKLLWRVLPHHKKAVAEHPCLLATQLLAGYTPYRLATPHEATRIDLYGQLSTEINLHTFNMPYSRGTFVPSCPSRSRSPRCRPQQHRLFPWENLPPSS